MFHDGQFENIFCPSVALGAEDFQGSVFTTSMPTVISEFRLFDVFSPTFGPH